MLIFEGAQARAGDPLFDDFLKRAAPLLPQSCKGEFVLRFGARAELINRASADAPFFLDFTSDRLLWRTAHSGRHSEAVCRAVLGKLKHPRVFDATAGLGRDALVLQCAGAQVTLFERNPAMWALLYDALKRAAACSDFITSLPNGLPELYAFGGLTDHPEAGCCDSVYFDPMFPKRTKSALVRRDMQVLHEAVGADEDADAVLPQLLCRAKTRVAVKRPAGAAALCEGRIARSGFTDGKACRFDLYAGKALYL